MTVLVVGNAVLDTSFEVARLPRPGESILADAIQDDLGGKGLIQAVAAVRAGATVILCASVGDDEPSERVASQLSAEGISSEFLLRNAGSSDHSTIFVMPGGENAIVTSAARSRSMSASDAEGAFTGLGAGDVLLMQGNLSHETTLACAELATRRGLKVLLNPSPMGFEYTAIWPHVAVAVLNEKESVALSGRPHVESGAHQLLSQGADSVVVTRGPRNVLIEQASGLSEVEVSEVEAIDTTGAGDVFCGVLATGVEAGMSLVESCRWAVSGASIAVGRRGAIAAAPTALELARLRQDRAEVRGDASAQKVDPVGR
jgi:ribokinase